MYSVADEEEAVALLTLACATDRVTGEFYAEELVVEQSLENLAAFSDRLHEMHEHLASSGQCRCKGGSDG